MLMVLMVIKLVFPISPMFFQLTARAIETQISHFCVHILTFYFLLLKYSSITSLACDSLP